VGIGRTIRDAIRARRDARRVRGRTKYFCIGRNKTGTTSLKVAFEELGFVVGRQRVAERLYDEHYFAGRFEPINDYCLTAEVFQDVPFSLPETYRHLDRAFPGSKFILSVRDDPEQWYRSLVSFQSARFGQNGELPTIEDLRAATYVRPGWALNKLRLYGTTEQDPYNRERLIAHYVQHNQDVQDYFADRPSDLLVINLSDPQAWSRFLTFVGVGSERTSFPWENRTA
jgi:hypothetical protein